MENPRLSVVCCAAFWLSACATQAPPATVPMAAPAQWHAPLPHNGSLVDLSQWWQSLGDPLLVQLVEAAQTASPVIATAQSRVLQSRAARVQAGAALVPALDATASAMRGGTQAAMPAASNLQAGLQASWEIDLFGANRLASEAAQARVQSAQAQWHEARVSVAAEVAATYFSQRSCHQQATITQRDADSRAQTSRLTLQSAQAGFTAASTAALAVASAAEANSLAAQQRALCEVEVKALVALTGLPESELRRELVSAPDDLAPAARISVASVPAQALAQRPDIFSAEREVAAASADVGSAQAQAYPRLGLNGSIGAMHYRAGGASDNLATWSIGPLALSVPLFDGGRRAATTSAAQARYDEAVALYRARVRQAVREVEEALVRLQSTAARNGDAELAIESYRVWLNGTEARFSGGLASLLELELSRRATLTAANALVALRHERILAWIALYRAVGGGWSVASDAMEP